jgi:hypothetical protein
MYPAPKETYVHSDAVLASVHRRCCRYRLCSGNHCGGRPIVQAHNGRSHLRTKDHARNGEWSNLEYGSHQDLTAPVLQTDFRYANLS